MNNRRYYKVSIKEPDQAHVRTLEKELGVSNLVAKILVARGMTTAQEAYSFLNPRLEELSDPFLLPDIDKGVARVLKALKLKEPICIYGDYDADGVTSCALMVNFFRELGISPLIYIPERREGYGINIQALRILKERDV
jgi:single-stranded-DNA-specific exonuclease